MHEVKKFVIVILGALLNALALNFFLIPANIYAGGFAGLSQLLSSITGQFTPFQISTGIFLFLLNVPVAILGWKKVGKRFTLYSFLSVVSMSFFLQILPIVHVSEDILLNAVFGGVIQAVGIGFTLKYGASTGGLDIITLVLSKINDRPIGVYFFSLNAVIIITTGSLYGWEYALYTLVTLYVATRVIDSIHTRHEKLTAMIITKKADELKEAIHSKLVRGITTVPAKGGFSNESQEMMIIVITRYELYDLERIIKKVDENAFTNIVQTAGIFGLFRKE
ncbi:MULTISPECIES: YitT family protein [unclassified Cytobacillus]|uniref:YitT family protein n=1 Tax=unclassified Cytobacillus TaxID=2675268 RepID=UPI002A11FD7D|nr:MULTISPECIES: YitT family protein [unclassified Cytobacillus]MDX8361347.1 YitT family protein [Cytobacillus sp. IB215316]MDX8364517.1 YitT family protein [Cytobacillus sp. IB215665]